jgi:hypothetical protein
MITDLFIKLTPLTTGITRLDGTYGSWLGQLKDPSLHRSSALGGNFPDIGAKPPRLLADWAVIAIECARQPVYLAHEEFNNTKDDHHSPQTT